MCNEGVNSPNDERFIFFIFKINKCYCLSFAGKIHHIFVDWNSETDSRICSAKPGRHQSHHQLQYSHSSSLWDKMWHCYQPQPKGQFAHATERFLMLMMLPGYPPQSWFDDVFRIFNAVTLPLGPNSFTIKHSTGTMYQSKWGTRKSILTFL